MQLVKKLSLTSWIFIALVLGVLLGVFFPNFSKNLAPISNIFLRLIKSIVGPLLFGTIVYGIAGAGELKTMGRIAVKSLVYFEVVTTLALIIGLVVVNVARPGGGLTIAGETGAAPALAKPVSLPQIIEHAAPSNIFESLAQNDVLQMVVFFFLFGAACAAIGPKAQAVVNFAGAVAEVMFRYTKYVMYFAPFGVGAAIAVTIGSKGIGVLFGLSKLVGALYLALVIFLTLVLVPTLVLARVPLERFLACSAATILDRFFDCFERSRASVGARKYGTVRHTEAHSGVRAANRLQLQSDRHNPISLVSLDFHCAGCWRTHACRNADHDDADADADQQRRGGCSAGGAGSFGRHTIHLSAPARRNHIDPRCRRADGYGSNERERTG